MADADRPREVAGYPVRVEHLQFGTLTVKLLVVDQLERYVDRETLLRDSSPVEPPYWAHLWTASRALARHIASRDGWHDKHVVDIGCGLGLLSAIAALKRANVTAIDMAPEAVAMAGANAELNHCRISARVADFRKDSLGATFDYCLAADVTYDPSLQDALAGFLDQHLAADGTAWCAESVRTRDAGFRDACAARGLHVSDVELTEIEEDRPVVVRVAEIKRR